MATIQWRPQVNALTTPPSYRIQHVPRSSTGYEEMAADIAATHPIYSADVVSGLAPLIMQWIQQQLINGNQVTLPDAFTFSLSFTGRLDSPDDPLPEGDDLLQVVAYASRVFVREIRHQARLERLAMIEKLPVITSTEDTKFKLADVLNLAGVLKLTGTNLHFDEDNPDCGCVLEGTQSGKTKQSTYASVSNSTILMVPDIPAQANPWNNEYIASVTTQYSPHGTLRTGTCRRRLRTPLTVTDLGHPNHETGILTGGAATEPFASIIDGIVSGNELLRIQGVLDARSGRLLLNLIDMREGGNAGPTVMVTANGEYSVEGFSGSAVNSLRIRVDSYTELLDLIRSSYTGRMVDILDIRI